MVVRVLSFMKVSLGKMDEIIEKLHACPQVKEVFAITGKYDVAAIIEAESGEELHDFFVNNVDTWDCILESNTNLILRHLRKNSP